MKTVFLKSREGTTIHEINNERERERERERES